MKQILVVLAAVAAAIVLSQLLFEFHSWDLEQILRHWGRAQLRRTGGADRPLTLSRRC